MSYRKFGYKSRQKVITVRISLLCDLGPEYLSDLTKVTLKEVQESKNLWWEGHRGRLDK